LKNVFIPKYIFKVYGLNYILIFMVDIRVVAKTSPKTLRVYLDNAYLRELDCRILNVYWEKRDRGYLILDRTIFHPKGGGQDCDLGFIVGDGFRFNVLKVLDVDDVIFHYSRLLEGSFKILDGGLMVKCIIDWDRRYRVMKLHTAGHILDYAVGRVYGGLIETLSANHSPPEAYIEYRARPPGEFEVKVLVEEANRIVREGRDVKIFWVESGDLDRYVFNAPNIDRLPKADVYRVVVIDGVNGMPCTGTHVSNTGEIKGIRVVRVEETNSGFKLYYDVM